MEVDDPPLAVLFAQISGSAMLGAALDDGAAAAAVNVCHGGLRAAVEKCGGTVVKTVGAELVARFDSADLALQAANAMQAFMRGQDGGLTLKAGFTFGPVIHDRQDVFGDTVNVAARMAAMANPRQILTTRQAVDTLSTFLRSTCRSLYTTEVKGRSERIAVYEAVWFRDTSTTVVGGEDADEAPATALLTLRYRGQSWILDERGDALYAGRDAASEIVVAGDNVSRHHARFFLRQGKFVIADQSANGTYLRVQQRAEIQLNREEFVLLGRGSIGLGQRVADAGDDAISFEIG